MQKLKSKVKNWYWNHHIRHWTGILVLLAFSVFAVNLHYEAGLFLASIYDTPEHEAFDGTTLPVQVAPDWSELSSDEYYQSYHEMDPDKIISIPYPNESYMTYPSENLVWGNDEHDVIRNTKITYPVCYTGNYELDDTCMGEGSHPAWDIKVPEGTPVYAVANGVITKSGTSSGFGNTVVIKHNDVPTPNGNGNTTLYSSYSHLSSYFVTEGDVVTKGEIIGEVGSTGTSTTSHLHFQLDNSNAPWHPYWPFTTSEASAAGYNFWDAVSYGVGIDNVYKYTENSLAWVYDNLNYEEDDTYYEDTEDEEEIVEDEIVEEDDNTEEIIEDENVEEDITDEIEENLVEEENTDEEVTSVVTVDFDNIEVDTPDMMMTGNKRQVEITLLDYEGDTVEDPQFDGRIEVSFSDESVAKLNRSYLEAVDFEDGVATLEVYADYEGEFYLIFEIAGYSFYSQYIYIIDEIEPFGQFGISTDGYFSPGVEETVQIQALTLSGKPTPTFNREGTVEIEVIEGDAALSDSSLTKKDFNTGVADISFISRTEEPVVLQVTYGTKVVESEEIYPRLFTDFGSSDNYYDAVSYLYKEGTIQGYPDGSFKPNKSVSRVEALKFIFKGLDQNLKSGLTFSFSDASVGEWYSDYLATAYSLGVVQGYSDGSFKPAQGVNRVEFLKMIFATLDVTIDPVVLEDPYLDVNNLAWYAPYVQYAKEKNLFPLAGSYFEPSDAMSRLEVAEVIYRLIAVQQNEGEAYSVLMKID